LFNAKDEVVLYLCLPLVTESILISVKAIIQNSENEIQDFILFSYSGFRENSIRINLLKSLADQEANLLVMQRSSKIFCIVLQN